MNNPSPFSPHQPILDQKNRNRRRVFVIGSAVVAANVVLLMTLLMIGCRKPAESEATQNEATNTAPVFDAATNMTPETPTNPIATNVYVPPVMMETNAGSALAPGGVAQDYKIAKGDTFATLATKFGVKAKEIQDANPGVDPKRLQIGQTIHIPAPSATATGSSVGGTSAGIGTATAEQTYKVKSGDTLTTIARHFGVTVKALRSANNLTSDRITVGQTLKIPAKPAGAAPATNPGTGA
jgi:LysM repeat protein